MEKSESESIRIDDELDGDGGEGSMQLSGEFKYNYKLIGFKMSLK